MLRTSRNLEIGKAGEHLICCDLIKQGIGAFLADQGLPYDIIADTGERLWRIQAKTTQEIFIDKKDRPLYRFGLRRGKIGSNTGSLGRVREADVDAFAFCALDTYKVAYMPIEHMMAPNGMVKQTMEFRSRDSEWVGRTYTTGLQRSPYGPRMEDYGDFEWWNREDSPYKQAAKTISYILELREQGFSYEKVSRTLNEEGFYRPKGGQWYGSTVRSALKGVSSEG